MSSEQPTSSSPDATHPTNGSTTVVDAIDDKRGQDPSSSTSARDSDRRHENKSTGTTSTTAVSSKANGRKKSVWSKLFKKLVPCVGPSPNAHPVEIDKVQPKAVAQNAPATEKSVETPASPVASPPTPTPAPVSAEDELPQPSPLVTTTHESTPEADIILPPASTSQPPPFAETEGVTSGAVQIPGSTGHSTPSSGTSASTVQQQQHEHFTNGKVDTHGDEGTEADEESEGTYPDDDEVDDLNSLDDEERLIMNGGTGIPIGSDGVPKPLLPPIAPQHVGRKCLVLDLDETLVHSSFKSIQHADYVVPVEIEFHWHNVYVIKRPGVDNFLKKMGEIYEIVVFTASLSKYADPVLDKLDVNRVVTHRLFRESCYNHKGNYVKDLSQLGRPIGDTIILDNSPASYIFHPNNAVPVSSWFNDPHDTELQDLIPFLSDLTMADDVRGVLDGSR